MNHITADELRTMVNHEGLILQGCGGDPMEWTNGINDLFKTEGILRNDDAFKEIYIFEHDNCTNILFDFENVDLDVGKLAMWRLITHETFGGTWLSDYLPNRMGVDMNQGPVQTERPDCDLTGGDGNMPEILLNLMDSGEGTNEINRLCSRFQEPNKEYPKKAETVLQMTSPTDITGTINVLNQLDLFEFIPGISTAEEYGRYMIIDSGYYEYDENLEEYIDFKGYGEQRMKREYGQFVENGYVSYHGFISIEEVMAGSETERMDMGGIQL